MRICSIDGCGKQHEGRGYCKEHYQQWYRYGDPLARFRAVRGTGWQDKDGYKRISKDAEHISIAERAIGCPLPVGAVVHHIDSNRANNRPNNLVVCPSQAYHLLIHQRQAALEACGIASHRKCVYCGLYSDPHDMSVHSSSRNSTTYRHKSCRRTK